MGDVTSSDDKWTPYRPPILDTSDCHEMSVSLPPSLPSSSLRRGSATLSKALSDMSQGAFHHIGGYALSAACSRYGGDAGVLLCDFDYIFGNIRMWNMLGLMSKVLS